MEDPASEPDLLESRLRVATWNLWWQFGPWEQRLPLIIDELRRVDADVIALQEVWARDGRTSADVIADSLGHERAFAAELEMAPGIGFGNAIISRWPIRIADHRALPPGDAPDERRVVLRCDIEGPRGAIQLFSTHLNWRFDHSHIRQLQVEAIAEFVQDSRPRDYPPIVCGDFNAEPTSDEIRTLTGQRPVASGLVLVDAWRAARAHEPGDTWDNDNPFVAEQLEQNRRIDYVFVGWHKARGAGNPVQAELIGNRPTDGIHPSDHYGVVTELRY